MTLAFTSSVFVSSTPHVSTCTTIRNPNPLRINRVTTNKRIHHVHPICSLKSTEDPSIELLQPDDEISIDYTNSMYMALLTSLSTLLVNTQPAEAVPEGLVEAFKSIPASLLHPATMWILFATCGYTFYLGYQSSLIRKSEPEKRKVLVKAKVTDRHFRIASALFSIMTIATFSGMANTYTRTGKLFPGPHLYAGLGLVALMSVMASFVPYMQKGKDWARNAHFSLAFFAFAFFGWQAKSGMVIVGKLLKWD